MASSKKLALIQLFFNPYLVSVHILYFLKYQKTFDSPLFSGGC